MRKPEWEILRCGGGFPPEVRGLRTSDYGIEETGGEKHKTDYKEGTAGRGRAVKDKELTE